MCECYAVRNGNIRGRCGSQLRLRAPRAAPRHHVSAAPRHHWRTARAARHGGMQRLLQPAVRRRRVAGTCVLTARREAQTHSRTRNACRTAPSRSLPHPTRCLPHQALVECGHMFCGTCLTRHWQSSRRREQQHHGREVAPCPVCRVRAPPTPHWSHALAAQGYPLRTRQRVSAAPSCHVARVQSLCFPYAFAHTRSALELELGAP
jgi:hypothetical protein